MKSGVDSGSLICCAGAGITTAGLLLTSASASYGPSSTDPKMAIPSLQASPARRLRAREERVAARERDLATEALRFPAWDERLHTREADVLARERRFELASKQVVAARAVGTKVALSPPSPDLGPDGHVARHSLSEERQGPGRATRSAALPTFREVSSVDDQECT